MASKASIIGKSMLLLADGSTYHVNVKEGDVFPRILTVGSRTRAEAIAKKYLTNITKEIHSSRDFNVYSGYYKDVGVTIISIGMGAPMMDFMVREISFVHPGPLCIIRFGTCGIFNKNLKPGTIITAGQGARYVYLNYPYFYGTADDQKELRNHSPYVCTAAVGCDEKLNNILVQCIKNLSLTAHDGCCASAETFYSCQGRATESFADQNSDLMDKFQKLKIDCMEMETHQLFHLAKMREEKCHVAAAAIGIVSRVSDFDNIPGDEFKQLELLGGQACLDALVEFQF